jgi:hypothetical protein
LPRPPGAPARHKLFSWPKGPTRHVAVNHHKRSLSAVLLDSTIERGYGIPGLATISPSRIDGQWSTGTSDGSTANQLDP